MSQEIRKIFLGDLDHCKCVILWTCTRYMRFHCITSIGIRGTDFQVPILGQKPSYYLGKSTRFSGSNPRPPPPPPPFYFCLSVVFVNSNVWTHIPTSIMNSFRAVQDTMPARPPPPPPEKVIPVRLWLHQTFYLDTACIITYTHTWDILGTVLPFFG